MNNNKLLIDIREINQALLRVHHEDICLLYKQTLYGIDPKTYLDIPRFKLLDRTPAKLVSMMRTGMKTKQRSIRVAGASRSFYFLARPKKLTAMT